MKQFRINNVKTEYILTKNITNNFCGIEILVFPIFGENPEVQ